VVAAFFADSKIRISYYYLNIASQVPASPADRGFILIKFATVTASPKSKIGPVRDGERPDESLV